MAGGLSVFQPGGGNLITGFAGWTQGPAGSAMAGYQLLVAASFFRLAPLAYPRSAFPASEQ